MVERCNNTSVGILVFRRGELLLMKRRTPPYGWAPPAGHVEDGEDYRAAAGRELLDEVGLHAARLGLVLSGSYPDRCRRPGGDWHRWEVYKATVIGEPAPNPNEATALSWAGRQALGDLAALSRQHLIEGSTSGVWQNQPGLEPVWLEMLTTLGSVQEEPHHG